MNQPQMNQFQRYQRYHWRRRDCGHGLIMGCLDRDSPSGIIHCKGQASQAEEEQPEPKTFDKFYRVDKRMSYQEFISFHRILSQLL